MNMNIPICVHKLLCGIRNKKKIKIKIVSFLLFSSHFSLLLFCNSSHVVIHWCLERLHLFDILFFSRVSTVVGVALQRQIYSTFFIFVSFFTLVDHYCITDISIQLDIRFRLMTQTIIFTFSIARTQLKFLKQKKTWKTFKWKTDQEN